MEKHIIACPVSYGEKGEDKATRVQLTVNIDTDADNFPSLLKVLVANAGRLLVGYGLKWGQRKDGTFPTTRAKLNGKTFDSWLDFEKECGKAGETEREAKKLDKTVSAIVELAKDGKLDEATKARLRALLAEG